MVIEYLQNIENDFMERLDHCEEMQSELDLQLKENERFIALLEETDDPYIEAFSPRQVNRYQKRKLQDLYNEQKELTEQIAEQKKQHEELTKKLEELKLVLKEARKKS